MTFGGGYAMLPILQREVVEDKGWITDEELADYIAIGQCTPGIISANAATFIGRKNRGIIGGIVATLGVIFPSCIIISVLAGLICNFSALPIVQNAFASVRVCVCILIFNAICKLWKGAVKGGFTLLIFLIVTLASTFMNISPVVFVLIASAIGLIPAFFKQGRDKGADAE
jgi:chromate transporter